MESSDNDQQNQHCPFTRPQLSWTDAVSIITQFFPKEWSNLLENQIKITHIRGGYINTVHLIERTTESVTEPSQVIIRQSGGGLVFKDDDEKLFKNNFVEEVIIFYEASKLSIGPKLYGAFINGRVEEYVNSHTLKFTDVSNSSIRGEIARKFAAFHTLKVPIRRTKQDDLKRIAFRDMKKFDSLEERLKCIPEQFKDCVDFTSVLQFDYLKEYEWIDRVAERVKSRIGLLLGDNNYLNVLVREGDLPEGQSRVVLIDYEASFYGPRCLDLGGHFVSRTIDWSLPGNKFTNVDILTDDERDDWIANYRDELFLLKGFDDLDPDETDSIDHIREEADMGILMQSLLWSFFLFNRLELFKVDPAFAKAPQYLLETYLRHKPSFVTKYPHWVN